MDAARTNLDGNSKDAVAEPDVGMSGRGNSPSDSLSEVREGIARFRADEVARLAARDDAAGGSLDRQGAAFSNPWADFADRHGRPMLQEAVIRFQPLLLLVVSLAATAAVLTLLGAFVTAVDVVSVHVIASGAE